MGPSSLGTKPHLWYRPGKPGKPGKNGEAGEPGDNGDQGQSGYNLGVDEFALEALVANILSNLNVPCAECYSQYMCASCEAPRSVPRKSRCRRGTRCDPSEN